MANYNQAIDLMPNYGFAYYLRGLLKSQLSNYEGTESDFTMALNLATQQPEFWTGENPQDYNLVGRDVLFNKIKDYAKEQLPSIYTKRAEVRVKLKKYPEAIEDVSEAIKLKPNDPSYYALRGEIHKEIKDYQSAIENYTKALELDPNNQNYQKALEYCRSQLQTINQQ